jgi:hypothetical protein
MYSPELTKAEAEYCKSNFTHKWHAHPKLFISASTAFIVLSCIGDIWCEVAPSNVSYAVALFPALLFLPFLLWLPLPCKCGAVALLTGEMRRILAPGGREQNLLISSIHESRLMLTRTAMGPLLLNLSVYALTLLFVPVLFGGRNCLPFLFCLFFCVIVNLVRWPKARQQWAMGKSEMERISSSGGESAMELEELIEFNLHIGNLERADFYSKRMLELALQH